MKEKLNVYEQKIFIQKTKEAASYFSKVKKYDRINRCYRLIDLLINSRKDLKLKFEVFKFLNELIPVSQKYSKNLARHFEFYSMVKSGFTHSAFQKLDLIEREYIFLNETKKLSNLYNSACIVSLELRDYTSALFYAKRGIKFNPSEVEYYQLQQQLTFSYLYAGQTFLALNEIDENEKLFNNSILVQSQKQKHFGKHHLLRSEAYTIDNDLHCANLYADSCIILCEKANPDYLIFAYRQKGIVLSKMGRQKEAIQYFQKFIKGQESVEDVREMAKNYLPLGIAYRLDGQFDAAITSLNNGISLVSPSFIAQTNKQINAKVKPTADMYYIDFLDEKAQCYLALFDKSKKILDLEKANKLLDTCTAFISQMKLFYNNAQAKFDLSKETKPIFGRSFETKIKLYELTKKSFYLEDAYRTKQDFGAFYLREQVNEKDMLVKTIKSQHLIDRYYSLKNSYLESIVESDLFNTPENQGEYASRRLKYEAYMDSLQKAFPSYKNFKKDYQSMSITEVKKHLKDGEQMISYFIGEKKIYAFYVSKENFGYISTPLDDSIRSAALQYLSILSMQSINKEQVDLYEQKYINVAKILYDRLLAGIPTLSKAKSLTIVPDGFLYKLPFDGFITAQTKSWKDTKSYLIYKYDIRYLYFVEQLKTKTDIDLNKSFLGLGLEYDNYTLESFIGMKKDSLQDLMIDEFRSSDGMSKLMFADDEVKAIGQILPGKVYTNLDATRDKVLSKGSKNGIIHISAHSVVDYVNSNRSSIIFTKKDSLTENLLDVGDITKLNLKSQLVTLSSCNSAVGRIFDGEGVSSLSKAFFEAGSRSVIGSCWSVSDQITKVFMESFYKKLADGMDKSTALRQTKLEIMSSDNSNINPAYKIPCYWAAWVLYGDTEPIIMANPWTNWVYVSIALVLLTLLFWRFRRGSLAQTN